MSRNPPSSSDPEIQGQSLGLAITASSWNSRMANQTTNGTIGSLDSQAAMDAIQRILPDHQQQRRLLESPLYHKGSFTHIQAARLSVSSASPVTFIHTPATHDHNAENDAPIEQMAANNMVTDNVAHRVAANVPPRSPTRARLPLQWSPGTFRRTILRDPPRCNHRRSFQRIDQRRA